MIATKVGAEVFGSKGLAPGHVASAVDASLKRLRSDYIDLYFAHYDDPQTPLETTLEAFDKLVSSGKGRAIGASNFTAERLRAALAGGDTRAHRDALVLGAGGALEVTGAEPDARRAVAKARAVLASGAGARLLYALAAFAAEQSA